MPALWGILGLSPIELLILMGMFVGGGLTVAVVVLVLVLVARTSKKPRDPENE
jgi:hypothetical protein